MLLEELKDSLLQAGIVGAGGAGFPAGGKLAPGANTLIVNGAECEPLMDTDYTILREHLAEVAAGAKAMMEAAGIERGFLGVKAHNLQRLGLADGQQLAEHFTVAQLPDVYPIGDEVSLIYQVTGRVVRPGALPITAGVIVYNVETTYNICRWLREQRPVSEKWLTIGGDIPQHLVVRTPVGTPVRELFRRYGVQVPEGYVVLDGGPSMGNLITWQTAVVSKTTKALLVLPQGIPAIVSKTSNLDLQLKRAASCCCQCNACSERCPRGLLGYPLEPHRMVRSMSSMAEEDPKLVLTATLCCGCGICEMAACCQGISPRNVIAQYKKVLAQKGLKYQTNLDVQPDEARDARMLPSYRWMAMLGVDTFDVKPDYLPQPFEPHKIFVAFKQHIGAPATACVAVGDRVEKGQVVAIKSRGLSVSMHSGIAGVVTAIDDLGVTIERKEGQV